MLTKKTVKILNLSVNFANPSALMKYLMKHLVFSHQGERRKAKLRYQLIHELSNHWPVSIICEVFEVSEFMYYRFRKNINKTGKDVILLVAMWEVLNESPYNDNYGIQRMQIALYNKGIIAGIRRITRVMGENS